MKKRQQYKKLIMFAITFVIWSALVGIWACVWIHFYSDVIIRPFGYKGNWLVYFVYGLVVASFTWLYGGYRIGYYKRGDVIFSNVLSIMIANAVTYLQTCLLNAAMINPLPFMLMTIVDVVVIIFWASFSDKAYYKLYPPHDMLVIYGGNRQTESLIYKMTARAEKYNICEAIHADEDLDRIFDLILRYESVIICDVPSGQRNKILKFCFENSVRTYLTPKISDIIVRGASNITLFDTPLLLCHNHGLSVEQQFFKRMLDLLVSGVGIVIASPFMFLTAVAVKLQDGGPALFKQERLTLHGKHFFLYKFRSMVVDAEKDGVARLASQGDSRITRLGKFIRATRLDEFPQLINIFKGDMSLVGPRPERPELAEKHQEEMPEFSYRLKVKAGLTGYAQVVGKYNTTAYDKLKLDLMYIENYSLLMDIKLILMTIKTMFMKESTEGVGKNDFKEITELTETKTRV